MSSSPWAPPTEEEIEARQDYDELPEVPEGTVLALPGPRFMHARGPGGAYFPLGQDRPILVSERHNSGLGTGLNTWDGALVLAAYLGAIAPTQLDGAYVLELGAGTGLAGIAAAKTGRPARVCLTDLPYTLDNLRASVTVNGLELTGEATGLSPSSSGSRSDSKTLVSVEALDWFAPPTAAPQVAAAVALDGEAKLPDPSLHPVSALLAAAAADAAPVYIIGADVVWVEELIPPFVNTLATLLEAAEGAEGGGKRAARALLAHQTRSHASDRLLVRLLAVRGWGLFPLPPADLHPTIQDPDIWVFEVRRLP